MFGRCTIWKTVACLGAAVTLCGQTDPPARGVARIALIQGDVSVKRGDSGDWVAAAPNAPLVVDDRVLTGVNSRAEVQFDHANLIRLSAQAELRLAELEYARYLVQLAAGTATFRVLRDSQADVEMSTPSVSVRPLKRGTYRLQVLPDGTTEIIVYSGEVEIFTTRGTERLRSGRMMRVRGTATDPEFQTAPAPEKDEWDRWNEERDRLLERSTSYRYVDPTAYGAEDLDYHGSWVYDPPYGWVWSPRVAVGWAPYRFGRWSWIDWYGWSWVSYDPWGWAPYHYGRWYHGPRGWCWWPGGLRVRQYWSPGLVAWFGFGGGGVGIGFGRVGWVPLAPYEPYHPWYGWNTYRGWGNRGVSNVTVVNNVNITNLYRNARVNDGITALESRDFIAGRVGTRLRLTENQLQRADLVRGTLPLAPDRASLRLADRDASPVATVRDDSRFLSRRALRTTERVPFEDQRRGVEEVARRTFAEGAHAERSAAAETSRGDGGRASDLRAHTNGESPAVSERLRHASQATQSDVPGSDTSLGSDAGRGWRRSEDRQPASSTLNGRPDTESTGRSVSESGWRRFGQPRVSESGGVPASSAASSSESSGRATTNQGWRRFGDPRGGGSSPVDPARTQESRGTSVQRGNWGGDGISFPRRPRETQNSGGRTEQINRVETPRQQIEHRGRPEGLTPAQTGDPSPGRRDLFRSNPSSSTGNSEPLRFSPPLVRERSAPVERPAMDAPRMRTFGGSARPSMDAPRSGGSFGGRSGGASTGGGGGGSARSGSMRGRGR